MTQQEFAIVEGVKWQEPKVLALVTIKEAARESVESRMKVVNHLGGLIDMLMKEIEDAQE